jgi:FlaA1/EpsC-like NDP-sugar epimerase
MVEWSIKNCLGGEIIIPKIKASSILSIANVMDPNKEVKIIGVRPGEKIHEQLFNRREHLNAYNVGMYYAILPERNEWDRKVEKYYKSNFKLSDREVYSSDCSDLQLSSIEICNLIKQEIKRLTS